MVFKQKNRGRASDGDSRGDYYPDFQAMKD